MLQLTHTYLTEMLTMLIYLLGIPCLSKVARPLYTETIDFGVR